MPSAATRIFFRDELIGFAKSKVMFVLWLLLPALSALGYLLIPAKALEEMGMDGGGIPMTFFMGMMLSSIAGSIAALMLGVDVVSERTRKVYELFIVRPVNPNSILWAKFFAVFGCVTIACVLALALGLTIDIARGVELPPGIYKDTAKSIASLAGVIALSAAVGILFATMSSSVLLVVILILFVGQNVTIVPMLPTYMGILPNAFWITMAITVAMAIGMMLLACRIFRKSEY